MKTNNLFAFFFLIPAFSLLASSIYAQSIIEDVAYIKRVTNDNTGKFPLNEKTKPVFEKYFGVDTATGYAQKIKDNPFLDNIFIFQSATGSPKVNEDYKSGPLGKIGNLDVTNLAFGMADFLVERTKTELNTAFFRRFQEEMNNKDYADLKTLFPETQSLLSIIGVEIYQFDHYLNALRNAFDKDLRMFQEHLPAVLENHKGEKVLKNKPELMPFLNLALELATWIKEERQPGEILKLLSEFDQMDSLRNLKKAGFRVAINSIQLVALISESLRSSTDTEHYWVNEEELKSLKNDTTFKIYLGLLYEVSKREPYNQITFPVAFEKNDTTSEKKLQDLLKHLGKKWPQIQNNIEKYRMYITTLGKETQQIMRAIAVLKLTQKSIIEDTSLSRMVKSQRLFDASLDVFNGLISLTNQSFQAEKLPYIKITIPENAKQISSYLETGGEIALHIAQKQYAGSVSKMVVLLDTLFISDDNKLILKKILKYGTFMANLVEAENPEQAKKAIAAVALPPGSYTIKRESRFSVALNGYLGVFGGSERIEAVPTKKWNNWAITAPVGFSLSWGNICPKAMRPWSLGLFVPIVDLGAVASYRFGNTDDTENTTEEAPSIQLKHLIAPGLFVEIGIGGTPLSFGLGGQFGPSLRKIENKTSNVGDTYYRLGATLKVDIPLLNFYANPGKR